MCQTNPILQKRFEQAEDRARIQQILLAKNKEMARAHLLQVSLMLSKQAIRR